jgi:hypothetical protein
VGSSECFMVTSRVLSVLLVLGIVLGTGTEQGMKA